MMTFGRVDDIVIEVFSEDVLSTRGAWGAFLETSFFLMYFKIRKPFQFELLKRFSISI